MKNIRPLFIVIAGLVIFLFGFAYDLIFAGIPYQDPSPEVYANWRFHGKVATTIQITGLCAALLGGLWAAIRRIFSKAGN